MAKARCIPGFVSLGQHSKRNAPLRWHPGKVLTNVRAPSSELYQARLGLGVPSDSTDQALIKGAVISPGASLRLFDRPQRADTGVLAHSPTDLLQPFLRRAGAGSLGAAAYRN